MEHLRSSVRCNILLIEDSPESREALHELLEVFGHRVEVACDGAAGVEAALKGEFDAILIDISLPDIDGYQVVRMIRGSKSGSRNFLIALSGWCEPENRERAIKEGFDYYLTKPVDIDALMKILDGRKHAESLARAS